VVVEKFRCCAKQSEGFLFRQVITTSLNAELVDFLKCEAGVRSSHWRMRTYMSTVPFRAARVFLQLPRLFLQFC
jgi:hypothetical protein